MKHMLWSYAVPFWFPFPLPPQPHPSASCFEYGIFYEFWLLYIKNVPGKPLHQFYFLFFFFSLSFCNLFVKWYAIFVCKWRRYSLILSTLNAVIVMHYVWEILYNLRNNTPIVLHLPIPPTFFFFFFKYKFKKSQIKGVKKEVKGLCWIRHSLSLCFKPFMEVWTLGMLSLS